VRHTARREGNCDKAYNVFHKDVDIEAVACVHNLQYSSVQSVQLSILQLTLSVTIYFPAHCGPTGSPDWGIALCPAMSSQILSITKVFG